MQLSRTLLFGLLTLLISCAGCQKPEAAADRTDVKPSGANPRTVFRIGYGKGGNFNILRLRGTLEKRLAPQGVEVKWLNFPMGPQMMEAIGTGSLDLGSSAATPPIFAQAAGYDFVYVANTPPGKSGSGGGIIVPIDSPIRSVRDLKGKRIAFQPGSVWQYLLIKLLEREGLQYSDIRPLKLPPSDATAAFHSGTIDAWVQGEPYLTLVQQKKQGRVLVDTSGIPTSGGFCLASTSFAKEHPRLLQAALDEVTKVGTWARQNPREAAALTASTVGLDAKTLETMIRHRENTELKAIDESVIAQQQEQADMLARLGILPKNIEVRQAVLSPKEYALIIPPTAPRQQARVSPGSVVRR